MMGGSGPGPWWPLMMLMPLVMLAGLVFVAWMLAGVLGFGPWARHGGRRGGQPLGPGSQKSGAPEDPLAVVRERYARGEISHDELDSYLDTLLRTDPGVARRVPGPRYERLGDGPSGPGAPRSRRAADHAHGGEYGRAGAR